MIVLLRARRNLAGAINRLLGQEALKQDFDLFGAGVFAAGLDFGISGGDRFGRVAGIPKSANRDELRAADREFGPRIFLRMRANAAAAKT
jgi:hypothetical protein